MTTRARPTTIFTATFCLVTAHAAAAPAPITEVVVYADRAQVTRAQTVECAAGQAVFSGLPSTLQLKTLWAALVGPNGEVVGVTHAEEATGPRPEAEALQQQVRKLDDQIVALDGERSASRAALAKLDSFRAHMQQIWGLQAAGKAPPVGAWDGALDLLQQQALVARRRARLAERKQRALRRDRAALALQLAQIQTKRRRTTVAVTALLRCQGRRRVQLSYVVPGATWRMAYELRADPATGALALAAQAAVQQGTGEDWSAVTLAVSTANLQRQNTPPRLRRMRVSTHQPAETRKVLTRRFERRRHLEVSAAEGKKKAQDASKQTAASGVAGLPGPAQAPEQALALQLSAAQKATVPSDGRRVLVTLQTRKLRGALALETVPKLYPYVYRKISADNPFAFPMLPGEVDLFSGRAFIGRSATKEVVAPGEPLAFSLGVDNQLQVDRYVKREKLEGAGTFGSSKKLRHRYVIQLGNWTKQAQRVRVQENIPVSQNREIAVALSDDATRPTKWNKEDGILTWEVSVPARGKTKLVLDYTVSLPKSYEVYGYSQ